MKEKAKSNLMSGASVAAGAGLGVVGGAAVAAEMNASNPSSSEDLMNDNMNSRDESFDKPELSVGHLEDNGAEDDMNRVDEPFKESEPTPSPADFEVDEVTVVQSESDPMPLPEEEDTPSGIAQGMVGGGGSTDSDSDFQNEYDLTGNPMDENDSSQAMVGDDQLVDVPNFDDGVNSDDPNADDVEITLSESDDLQVVEAETPIDTDADDIEITLSDDSNSDFPENGAKEMFLDGNGEAPMPDEQTDAKGVYDFGNSYDNEGFENDDYNDDVSCGDDGDIQILGAETIETEDGDMDVVGLSVDGTEAYIVDVDQDGIADAMVVDADGDGEISDDEILDVTDDEMSMSDFTEDMACGEDSDFEEDPYADTDLFAHEEVNDDSNSCDYVNDANVDDYLA